MRRFDPLCDQVNYAKIEERLDEFSSENYQRVAWLAKIPGHMAVPEEAYEELFGTSRLLDAIEARKAVRVPVDDVKELRRALDAALWLDCDVEQIIESAEMIEARRVASKLLSHLRNL